MKQLIFSLFILMQLHATISWNTPTTLSSASANVTDHRIVMDSSGNATVVYVEAGVVKAQVCPLNGSWSGATTLSGSGASGPSAGVDSSGKVTAVWSTGSVVQASTYSGGSWSGATTLSSSGTIQSPSIAVRSNGDMVAVWVRNGVVESATKLSGDSWGSVNTLSASSSDHPAVAIGANGTVCAIWHTSGGSGDVIMATTATVSGSWNTAVSLVSASPAYVHNYPSVSVDLNGNAEAIWYRYQVNGSDDIAVVINSSSLPNGATAWSTTPTYLSDVGIGNPANFTARVVHDSFGNALAIWSISYDDSSFVVETAFKSLGQNWTTPGISLTQSNYSFGVDASLNSLNDAVVAYMQFDGTHVLIQGAEATINGILPNLFWTQATTISSSSNNTAPRIASTYATNHLYAACSWIDSNSGYNVLQASVGSRSTLAPPTSLSVQQTSTSYGVFTDYYNTLTWSASSDASVIGYAIFRNDELIGTVAASTLTYVEHNTVQNGSVTYTVTAFDFNLMQSASATASFP